MRITYSTTAYVQCPEEILDLLGQEMNSFAQGDGNVCMNREQITTILEVLEENLELSDEEIKLHKFLSEVDKALYEKEIGDVIFCK